MVLVSDFDKTLYDKNYENNIKAVNDFIKKGNIFIIMTGRSISWLKEKLNPNLNFSYVICNDGGMIFDHDFNLIYRKDISKECIEPIFMTLKKSVYVGNPLIDLGYGYRNDVCKEANAIIARVVSDEETSFIMNELLKEYPNVTAYMSDSWINFADKTVNKINAIKWLGKKIKVKPRHMYIIGDNINDIKMCKLGKGFAMENGHEELKRVCRGTVKSVEELINSL